ncbi:lipopolysaccharide biosynthesis protein [Phycicoccus sp. 3266]|uniref:lipopolysaccharide biosynthesis protein n=1 Tax=Phycicoccus sp. 3266 TaxID=2817751 RepID=UPI002857CBF3|nr:lipopolysaccharide biosynthesis protein [Phycicoccus sp. 3266]MDR6862294.1 putative peptidoglycan lipid II flippase [Phycicoccus sp. 3266]
MTTPSDQPASGRAVLFRPVRLDRPVTTSMATRGLLGLMGTGSQGALRFLSNALVGRLAGPAVLGAFQGAISLAMLLSLLWPTTTGSAAAKFLARARGAQDPEQARAVAAHLSRRTVQAGLLLGVAAAPLWWFTSGEDVSVPGALCVVLLVLGYSGYAFSRGVQYGVGEVWRGTVWDVMTSSLGLVATGIALAAGVRGPALLLPLACTYGLYTFAGWPHGSRGTLDRDLRREIDSFVALGAAGSIASAGFLQLSMLVVKAVSDKAEAGHYAAAMTLATPASLLAGSLSLVLFPSMAEAWGRADVEGFRRQTDQATRALFVTMVAVFGTLALCGRLVVALIWGSAYVETGRLLPVLLAAVLATTLGVASVNAITTGERRGMLLTTLASLAGMLVGVVAWLLLVPSMGPMGVALGYLAGTTIIAGVPFVATWRRYGHEWAGLVLRLLVAVVAVGAACVVGWQQQWGAVAQLGTAVLFLAAWLVAGRGEVRTLVGGRLQRLRRR